VEVTENELVAGDPTMDDALADLRRRGARLAVDDVGAGYAGLTHVMRLAPDVIKLDRAITTGIDADPVKAALVGSFVRYARDIDATVCAEGVETLEELERLADLDVTYGQGYGIARPSAPWAQVAPAAATTCLRSFQASIAEPATAPGRDEHDRRLESLTRRLADATTDRDLAACLEPIALELRADEVRVVAPEEARALVPGQLLARDPAADPHATARLRSGGFGSCLALPIASAGRTVGYLEAYCREERPWSRFEIGRGRMLTHQLGAAMHRTGASATGAGLGTGAA
jgi:GAF domain-containing protein